jgi:Tfp pilus assembly protein PilF
MDLVKGVPITKYCDEHHLTPRQRLELFVPVCQAVQHAHQKGIIHRDLKPSNVLVAPYDGRPVVKVIDFGVAKAAGQQLTDKTLVTGFGNIVGTLEYMSPEQAEINQLDIDTRSDIYSLGVLLYELLTGSPPFTRKELEKGGMLEMLRVIREQEPTKPSTKLSTAEGLPTLAANRGTEPAKLTRLVRGELDWIVMKALEKDRNRRYETANGFALDVQRYLHDEPVLAGPPGARYRLRKFVHRNKGPVLAAALLLLTLVLGIIGTTVGLVLADQARLTAQAETAARERALAHAAESAAQARRDRERAEKRLAQIEKNIAIIGELFKDLDPRAVEKEDRPLQAILGDRLDAAARELEAEAVGDPLAVARLQHILGQSLLGLGYPEKAIDLFSKARRTREQLLPRDDPDTLTTMNYLAWAYLDAGRDELAVPLHRETLEKRKATLGADHPATLESMNNLAGAYSSAGRLDLALPLYRDTLEKRNALLGAGHPATLTSMNNLAMAYEEAGRLDLALPLHRASVEKSSAILGADHPDTFESMNNLAGAYVKAGRLDLALPLYLEALEKMKAKLGAGHPSVFITLNNLAGAYHAGGKFDLALPLLLEALEKQKAKLGADHRSTVASMNNLAEVYRETGQLDLALPLYLEALERRKVKPGAGHPHTLRVMNNLALAYLAESKLNLARPLFQETLEKRRARLGADHPETLQSMDGLALAYVAEGNFELAVPLLRDALQKSKIRPGADHPQTLKVMNNLAYAYQKAGERALALPLYLETLEKQKVLPGADHPDTLATMNNLAVAYHEAREFDLAVALFRDTLQKCTTRLGADHPKTLITMTNLASTYRQAGKLDLALPLSRAAVEKMKEKLGAGHPETLNSMNNLAVAYLDAGKPDLALPIIVEASQKASDTLGANHPRALMFAKNRAAALAAVSGRAREHFGSRSYADAEALLAAWVAVQRPLLPAQDISLAFHLNLLGECQVMQKHHDAAEKTLRESLAIYEKKQPTAVMRYDTQSLLGAALAGQKKFTEAEPLLVGSAKVLLANHGKLSHGNQLLARAAGQRVVDLYHTWDRPEDAAAWRKKLDEVKKKAR